jgi:hypothetical protein
MRKCDIPQGVLADAEKRLNDIDVDPVGEFRKKAAEAAAKAAQEALERDPHYRPQPAPGAAKTSSAPPVMDAASVQVRDSLSVSDASKPQVPLMTPGARLGAALSDTLATIARPETVSDIAVAGDTAAVMDSSAVVDSTALTPPDTTKIGFLEALKNVRIYKKDMQVICDSLVYSDLDSLARLFKSPIIWQETTRQYSADSISVVISDGAMDKASLIPKIINNLSDSKSILDNYTLLCYPNDRNTVVYIIIKGVSLCPDIRLRILL